MRLITEWDGKSLSTMTREELNTAAAFLGVTQDAESFGSGEDLIAAIQEANGATGINLSAKVRERIYMFNLFGLPVLAYLQETDRLGPAEVALATAWFMAGNLLAKINVPKVG